jgi:hypothetical protein
MPRARLNLSGQKFGHLQVIAACGSNGQHSLWEVRCDCGSKTLKIGKELRNGRYCSHRCPLFLASMSRKRATHSMSRHPVFAVWRSMLARCRNPRHRAYRNYGGRGIGVCPEWTSFEAFWRDMKGGYEPGLTLDRIDNDSGYSKENCRWTTPRAQCRNKRNNVVITTPGGRMTVAEASDRFGVGRTTIFYRISRGWPERMLLINPNFTNRITS